MNPHFGTPRNPWDRAVGRIPGGSSAGAAVSVTDGMAPPAIGTDTGGSVRIPAALCGIVGFKPTARTGPADRDLPALAEPGLDRTARADASRTARSLDAIMAGVTAPSRSTRVPMARPALLAPTNYVRERLRRDGHGAAFAAALRDAARRRCGRRRSAARAARSSRRAAGDRRTSGRRGVLGTAAAARGDTRAEYDPNVYFRIMRGEHDERRPTTSTSSTAAPI